MPDKGPAGKSPAFRQWLGPLLDRLGWPRPGKNAASPAYQRAAPLLLLLGLSLVLTFLLAPQPQQPLRKYKLNAIAQENFRAVGDLLVEDVETTQQRRQELLAQVPPLFDLDEQVAAPIKGRFQHGLEFMRQASLNLTQEISGEPGKAALPRKLSFTALSGELLKRKAEFDKTLEVSLPKPTFQLLVKTDFSPLVEALFNQVLEQTVRQGVITQKEISRPLPKEIVLRRLPSGEEQVLRPPYPFLVLDDLRKPVAAYCREVAAEFPAGDRFLVCDLVQHLVVPNVAFNQAETLARQEERLKELRPTLLAVKKGELLVQEGERITPLHLAKLKAQTAFYPPHRGLLMFLGTWVSIAIILWLAYHLARIALISFSSRFRDLLFLASLVLVGLLMNKGLVGLAAILAPLRPELAQNLIYTLPIALAPICAALFLGLETGLALAFLMATLTALLLERPFPLFLYLVCASLVGVWGVRNFRQRRSLINTGLAICAVNLVMVTAFKLLEYPFALRELLLAQAFALAGGLLTGILALGLTPIIESLFRYTSNIRFLEILSLEQPLLKELMLVAPGSYHHSLVVGQIVEAAAAAIGANPMLAKAAAYYHDIGKIKKPAYFVENQLGAENKHEKLAPSMSSLILIAHVKDGVELARKHRLGEAICNIIQQHHGTCFISYFYNKAKSQAADPNKVNVDDYRYPGPRPQTKEAALVLVADQVEAASKTLTDPTPARIQGMVQKIINNIFGDGQLNDCELTLRELNLIARHCTKILSGIFHQRVLYPASAEKTRSHEDSDKQPPKKNGLKPGSDPRKSQEDLKRLGMG